MKLVYTVGVISIVVIGNASNLWAQTIEDRSIRERLTVLEEKFTAIDQRMDKIEGMISSVATPAQTTKTQWLCEGFCSFPTQDSGDIYEAVYGRGLTAFEAIKNMRDECEKKTRHHNGYSGSPHVLQGNWFRSEATIQNSCHQE